MKKWSVMMALILSAVLMIGCGKERTEESQEGSKEESQVETDASGDAIVINDIPQATEEMNQENSMAQAAEPEQEPPAEELAVEPEVLH